MQEAFLVKFWSRVVGPAEVFNLETRIYHTFCFLTILAVLLNTPFRFLNGLEVAGAFFLALALLLMLLYYLSRFKGRQQLSFVLTGIVVNLLLGISYFYNAGISGTQILLLAFSYFCIIAVAPTGRHNLWTGVNLVMVMCLLAIEYLYPSVIRDTYQNQSSHYLDIGIAYLMVIVLIRICVPAMVGSYNAAKDAAEQNSRELARLNGEKDKLFSIVSHDMQAPLATIQNYLELLEEMELSAQEKQEINGKLLASTRGTLEMLGNVLSWSKGQLEGRQLKLSPIGVSKVLDAQLVLFGSIAANKGIKLEIAIDPDLHVLGDAGMLQLIVRNLVNNAIKFTAVSGQILVSVAKQGAYCLLKVADSGTGKPVRLTENIFELSGASTSGTANEKGVGLGLVLCREFSTAQNGRIWYECNSVSGTCFFVELLLAQEAQPILGA